ncbi:MAG: nucleoside recognition protein, partial [Deltaproteobacteria bacterium]|nr:nucleoside recognition protein [Deltaproteobacteria bacterium]
RALRHQLPRYLGIFSPGIGLKLLLAGQAFRIASLVVVGCVYYYIG